MTSRFFLRSCSGILNNLRGLGTELEYVLVPARQAALAGEIDSLESIPGLLKSFKMRALDRR